MTDVVLLIKALMIEMERRKEFDEKGSWHTDECNCDGCQILDKWQNIGWWRRLKAKLSY